MPPAGRGCALALIVALGIIPAALATNNTIRAVPTMYYRDHPVPPRWVATPLPDLHFSWEIVWDATKSNASIVGTFNYTAGDMWVGIGLKSLAGGDGLCVVCYAAVGGAATCTDWENTGTPLVSLSSLGSSYSSADAMGVQQVVFSRTVFANGKDLGVAAWSAAERVTWAWGPMGGKDFKRHPGQGIASSLINFQTGEVVDPVNPNTHLVPVYVALGLTAALIIGIQATVKFRIPVHHHVRTATGVVAFLAYLGLWIWYIVASMDDYTSMGRLLPAASATGDAAAACIAVLLISGSRRFIAPDLLTVSHERMMVFHAATAVVLVASMLTHAILMIQMFWGFSFEFRWTSVDRYNNLPGFFSGLLILVMTVLGLLRHRVSYRAFRYSHVLWVLVVLFASLHVYRLFFFFLPGLLLLGLNFVYGRVTNMRSRVEGAFYDAASGVVVLDISRPYWSLFNWSGCRVTGLAPGQWFYICNVSLSWAWHPISVARAQVRGGRQHLRFMIRDTKNALWTSALAQLVQTRASPINSAFHELLITADETAPPPPPKLSTWTWIEGPFGRQQLPLETYPRIVLVSGGIGVTPHLQTLQHLAEMSAQLKAEGRAVPWTSVLWLWTFREPSLLALVSDDLIAHAATLRAAGVDFLVRNACSGAVSTTPRHRSVTSDIRLLDDEDSLLKLLDDDATSQLRVDVWGRLDLASELLLWRDTSMIARDPRIALYACGPPALISTVPAALLGSTLHVHVEVFEM